MSRKPVVLRPAARRDIFSAVEFYASEGGEALSLRFSDAVERGLSAIGLNPASGSPRYGHELGVAGLRTVRLRPFPYLVFYLVTDRVDVWRVLHGQRDIPDTLRPDLD
jgi:toxin ParE1/3/4